MRFEKEDDLFTIEKQDGTPVPVVRAYWFAWQAFYPETELWQPEGS